MSSCGDDDQRQVAQGADAARERLAGSQVDAVDHRLGPLAPPARPTTWASAQAAAASRHGPWRQPAPRRQSSAGDCARTGAPKARRRSARPARTAVDVRGSSSRSRSLISSPASCTPGIATLEPSPARSYAQVRVRPGRCCTSRQLSLCRRTLLPARPSGSQSRHSRGTAYARRLNKFARTRDGGDSLGRSSAYGHAETSVSHCHSRPRRLRREQRPKSDPPPRAERSSHDHTSTSLRRVSRGRPPPGTLVTLVPPDFAALPRMPSGTGASLRRPCATRPTT